MGMAGQAGLETTDLERRLLAEPRRFSMVQALWLLGFLNSDTKEAMDDFLRRRLKVVPWLSLGFPPGEVASVERWDQEGQSQYLVTVPYYGLYSTMGALPTFYTEELLDEAREDQRVSRDFLDVLNNHLYHLLYAASRHDSLERRTVESVNRSLEFVQYCLMGQAEEPLRDSSLAGLDLMDVWAQRPRSAARLERSLAARIPWGSVEVEQCVFRQVPVHSSQRCSLGVGNCRLGEDALLGAQVEDWTGKFRIHLWEAPPQAVERFLPARRDYEEFHRRVQRYLDSPQDFDLRLHPTGETGPPAVLGQVRLGFYLGNQACQAVTVSWNL